MKYRCVQNPNDCIDLIVGNAYHGFSDEDPQFMLRIVDESGEDYLYPRDWFKEETESLLTFEVRKAVYLPTKTVLMGELVQGCASPGMEIEVPTARNVWSRRILDVETFIGTVGALIVRGHPPRKDILPPCQVVSYRI